VFKYFVQMAFRSSRTATRDMFDSLFPLVSPSAELTGAALGKD
jgi:hypothetical protein